MHRFLSILALALLPPASALAEQAWTTGELEAKRWPDAELVSLTLEAGEQVTVVYKAEGLVRVRKGTSFGWVPEAALTDQDPNPAAPADDPWAIPDLPTLEIPGPGKAPMIAPKVDMAPAAPTPADQ